MFGYSHLYGGVAGGQADYVRVPKANVGPFKVPGQLADDKVLFLSDILPTAWQAVLNAEVGQGASLAIYGRGRWACCRRLAHVCWASSRSSWSMAAVIGWSTHARPMA